MAVLVASVTPSPPSIVMYIHEIGRIEAEPQGRRTALAPMRAGDRLHRVVGQEGREVRLRPIGPMPGPPPPCGMAKVLCRFMWLTSAPMAGRGQADLALRLAPSIAHLAAVLWMAQIP